MPFFNDPKDRNWTQIAEDLRALQGFVDLYKKRFEAAGHADTAAELGECVLSLMSAEGVAKTVDLEGLW
jgi:hypothetical protein